MVKSLPLLSSIYSSVINILNFKQTRRWNSKKLPDLVSIVTKCLQPVYEYNDLNMFRMSLLHYWQKTDVEGALRKKYKNSKLRTLSYCISTNRTIIAYSLHEYTWIAWILHICLSFYTLFVKIESNKIEELK